VEVKVFVNTAGAGNEVVLLGVDGAFHCIATMHARWSKLEVGRFITKELLKGGGALIVEALELGTEAGGREGGMECLVTG
jgi:hypothetical protein